jgi:hypothetical protein
LISIILIQANAHVLNADFIWRDLIKLNRGLFPLR